MRPWSTHSKATDSASSRPRMDEMPWRNSGGTPGPRPARPHAPELSGMEVCRISAPSPACRSHAHRQGLGGRQGRRPGARRRRLCHEAVLTARAHGARPGLLRRSERPSRARRRRDRRLGRVQVDLAGHRLLRDGTSARRSSRRRSSCWRSCCATRARSSPATSCWSRSGATTTRARRGPSMSTSTGCAGQIEDDPGKPGLPPDGARRGLRVPPRPS